MAMSIRITLTATIQCCILLFSVMETHSNLRNHAADDATDLEYGLQWDAWKATHSRSYLNTSEELERYVIWRSNQAFIENHNSYAEKLGFTLQMNQFGDLVSLSANYKPIPCTITVPIYIHIYNAVILQLLA